MKDCAVCRFKSHVSFCVFSSPIAFYSEACLSIPTQPSAVIALETSKTAKRSEFLRHERWRMSFLVEFLLLNFYEVHMGMNHGEACVQQRGLGTWVTSLFLMSRLNKRMNHPISFYPGKEKRESEWERWHLTETRSLLCRLPGHRPGQADSQGLGGSSQGAVPQGALRRAISFLSLPPSALSTPVSLGAWIDLKGKCIGNVSVIFW